MSECDEHGYIARAEMINGIYGFLSLLLNDNGIVCLCVRLLYASRHYPIIKIALLNGDDDDCATAILILFSPIIMSCQGNIRGNGSKRQSK